MYFILKRQIKDISNSTLNPDMLWSMCSRNLETLVLVSQYQNSRASLSMKYKYFGFVSTEHFLEISGHSKNTPNYINVVGFGHEIR